MEISGTEFDGLVIAGTLLCWTWMLTGGLQVICQRVRAIFHDRGYITGWEDLVTGFVVLTLLVIHRVIL